MPHTDYKIRIKKSPLSLLFETLAKEELEKFEDQKRKKEESVEETENVQSSEYPS